MRSRSAERLARRSCIAIVGGIWRAAFITIAEDHLTAETCADRPAWNRTPGDVCSATHPIASDEVNGKAAVDSSLEKRTTPQHVRDRCGTVDFRTGSFQLRVCASHVREVCRDHSGGSGQRSSRGNRRCDAESIATTTWPCADEPTHHVGGLEAVIVNEAAAAGQLAAARPPHPLRKRRRRFAEIIGPPRRDRELAARVRDKDAREASSVPIHRAAKRPKRSRVVTQAFRDPAFRTVRAWMHSPRITTSTANARDRIAARLLR